MNKEHIAPDTATAAGHTRHGYAESQLTYFGDQLGVRGLTTIVGPGVTDTAAFDPATHTMLVNSDFALPKGYDDYSDHSNLLTSQDESYRVARGAVIHECAHALFSRFSLPDIAKLDRNVGNVIIALEELRIEWNMVNRLSRHESDAEYLIDLVYGAHFIAKHNIPSGAINPVEASTLLALTYGRLDAGVLSFSAGMAYRDAFELHFDPDLIDALRQLWVRYMGLTDRDMETRIEIAKEWLDLFDADTSEDDGTPGKDGQSVGESGEADGEGEGEGDGEGQGDNDEGEGEGKGDSGKMGSGKGSLSDDVKDAAEYAYEISRTDVALDKRTREEAARRAAKAGAAKAREKRVEAATRAHKSHGMGSGDPRGYYGDPLFAPSEKPTSSEQQGMIALARKLDKVSYIDKHKTRVGSEIPPGKLSGRGIVQAGAQKAQGRIVTAKPWRTVKRRSVPKTPLTVGIIADVSGSMSSSVKSVSTAAWMLSEAVNRVQGRTSTVLMGAEAYGLIAPGQRLHEVPRYNAVYGFENFTEAFDAIDGSLNLTMGRGARILFCVTDAHFVSGPHNDYAYKAMRECKASGVQVFWLDYDGYASMGLYPDYGHGEVIEMEGMTHQKQAETIGLTVIRAFDAVKNT